MTEQEVEQTAARAGIDRAELYRELIESAPASLVVYDSDLRIRLIAGRALKAAGEDPSRYEGQSLKQVLPLEQVDLLTPVYRMAFEGAVRTFRYVSATDDREYELIVCPICKEGGKVDAGLAISFEVSGDASGDPEPEVEHTDRGMFRTVFEEAPFGIAIVSISGLVVDANPMWATIVKRSRAALRGAELAALPLPGHGEQIRAALEALIAGEPRPDDLEIVIPLPTGGDVHCQLALSVARGAGNAPLNVIAQLQDISERKQTEEQLRYQADHDPLTNLLNRRAMEREFVARIRGARDSDQGAMLLIDLDGLKEVNDQFGHPAGDETLRRLGSSLSSCVRSGDPIGRVGGDEFAVLAATQDQDVLASLADRLLADIRIRTRDHGIPVSASIGIALIERSVSDRELWRRADSALYTAKGKGGDRHTFWSPELGSLPRLGPERGSDET